MSETKITILKSSWSDNRGLGAVIFALLANLMERKNDEIFYLYLGNLFYSNTRNFWDKAFFQPFEESISIIQKKINSNKTNSKKIFLNNFNYEKLHKKGNFEEVKKLFKKFVKPKKDLDEFFFNNYHELFKKNKVASLHIRGNAMFSTAHAANQSDKISYKSYIKPLIKKILGKGFQKIILCTIDDSFREQIINDFSDKIIYMQQNLPKNRMHPSYDPLEEIIYESEQFKNQLILDPIIEAFVMSKAMYSYYMRSNVSYMSILYRGDFKYEFIDDHIDYSRYG